MNNFTNVRVCPVCKNRDSVTAVCNENGIRNTFALCTLDSSTSEIDPTKSVPLNVDICTKCGHIILFHAQLDKIEIKSRNMQEIIFSAFNSIESAVIVPLLLQFIFSSPILIFSLLCH